jgi:threonine aldolase
MLPTNQIDLRSDTVTKPTKEMRTAMANAEVGDDVYCEDPTVNLLQERAAEIFGKEAGIFVPTGTMGNQIAIHLHAKPGSEVITEERGHIFNYELASMATVSGTLARPVAAQDGILDWELIEANIRPDIYYLAPTGLITLENTHNMAGGTLYTKPQIDEICTKARDYSLPVHMDGARIFNAANALQMDVAELTSACDSLMFCLSTGLAAPVGSVLVGTKEFIDKARRVRKMLGGGMRQAGVLAAAGLIAIEKMPARLAEDHENARFLAEMLSEISSLHLDPSRVRTNIVVLDISKTGYSSSEISEKLLDYGVFVGTVDAKTLRLLTHLDVSRKEVIHAAKAFISILS